MTLLLCTDLDRTLIPNGEAPESPGAREAFARLVERDDVVLVFVTGRDIDLTEDAIRQHDLPRPDFAVTDVGTTIWARDDEVWSASAAWTAALSSDWGGRGPLELAALLDDLEGLRLQDDARQGRFKLSYTTPGTARPDALLDAVDERLATAEVAARIVWSVDDLAREGLVDVLPCGAGKLAALRFVAQTLDLPTDAMLFAGDSGNDLDVLTSDVPAVLVANAAEDVRRAAVAQAEARGTSDRLHLARGGLAGMNGHYAAGILEGVARFHPALVPEFATDGT